METEDNIKYIQQQIKSLEHRLAVAREKFRIRGYEEDARQCEYIYKRLTNLKKNNNYP